MAHLPRILIPVPTSFDPEYNHRTWPEYAEAVRQEGGDPVRLDLTMDTRELERAAVAVHAILLPGSGADWDPDRYGHATNPASARPDAVRQATDTALIDAAVRSRIPLFCICFGMQSLNVLHGGSLVQDLLPVPVNHRARGVAEAHSVLIAADSRLGRIVAPHCSESRDGLLRLGVNSSHHQAAGVPGDSLAISARCPEDGVIEALESTDPQHWLVGVQWHPERTAGRSAASAALFREFVSTAAERAL